MSRLCMLVVVGALAAAGAGCSRTMAQDRIEPPLPHATMVDGAWQTSNWFSPVLEQQNWLVFPPATTLVLRHPLGRVPVSLEVYVTIDEAVDGANPSDFGAGAGIAAGNQARIIDVNAMTVELRNDTETAQRLRVVLR